MSTAEPREQTVPKWARQARTLSEALGIKPERHVSLATIFTQCVEHDSGAPESLQTVVGLWKDGKITDNEAAFLLFGFGWMTGLNAVSRTIDTQILGMMRFDRKTGELEDA